MQITFEAIGLTFAADVSYHPGASGTQSEPIEPSNCIIEVLAVRMIRLGGIINLRDADYLLQSDVAGQIQDAAHEAADAAWPAEQARIAAEMEVA